MVELPSSGFAVTPYIASDKIWRFTWWSYQVVGLQWHHVLHLLRLQCMCGSEKSRLLNVSSSVYSAGRQETDTYSLKRDVIHGITANPLIGNSTMQTFKSEIIQNACHFLFKSCISLNLVAYRIASLRVMPHVQCLVFYTMALIKDKQNQSQNSCNLLYFASK